MPTHAAPSIWKGSHGPTPPVRRADANIETAPRLKPNPGPRARPPRMSTIQIGSSPAVPAPSGRRAAMTALSTPSMAMALASIPPSLTCVRTTTSRSGTTTANRIGASLACATAADSGAATSGHRKATSPTAETMPMASRDAGPRCTALLIRPPPRR